MGMSKQHHLKRSWLWTKITQIGYIGTMLSSILFIGNASHGLWSWQRASKQAPWIPRWGGCCISSNAIIDLLPCEEVGQSCP